MSRTVAGGVIVVKVKPGAKAPGIFFDSQGCVVVSVRERAAEGRANEAVRRALADALDVPSRGVTLVRGATSRVKAFSVGDLTAAQALERLRAGIVAPSRSRPHP